jgi:hypothetical protein
MDGPGRVAGQRTNKLAYVVAALGQADVPMPRYGRAYASPFLQNTVGQQDFIEKIRVQGSGESFLGDAQLGRVSL